VEEVEGCFYPLPPWLSPTPDQWSLLLPSTAASPTQEEAEASICLFQLPVHLRAQWWKVLECSTASLGSGALPGMGTFVGQVVDFLNFKNMLVPEGASCKVVLTKPGQRSIARMPEPRGLAGLQCCPGLRGGINLGDEETAVVVINLPCQQLAAHLQRRCPDQACPETVDELARCFLRSFPDCSPVRLQLKPGEGFRLPRGGLIMDGYVLHKLEPDVLLLVFCDCA
jgi:hypothetical protein